jgi:fatty-acyl-CoA synthase
MSNRVMNLSHILRQAARRHPDRTGLVWGEQAWSWRALDERVDALVSALAGRGIGKGDRILVQSRNGNPLIETMFACFRLGAVWVPVNFRLLPDDVAWIAQASGARLMIHAAEFADHAAACNLPEAIVIDGDFEDVIAAHRGGHIDATAVEYDDPCWFFFTSGTTGRPKAAVLTHGQMAFVLTNHLCDLMPGVSHEDASLVVAPLTHGAGVHMLTQVARGAMTILPASDRLDPETAWALVERWRVTNMFTVPTILKLLVEHPAVDRHDHASLRHVIYAGAPMYREDQKRALRALGPVLVQYFGLGEVTGAITVLPPEDHFPDDAPGVKLGTCGRERTGMEVSIQDDAGHPLPPGETGEICVCGPAVFAGYHDNPEANRAAFRNGWFRTGDLGHMDEAGDLFITGRASDMYISGGSNIYPREIEDKILEHPDIDEACVLGVTDATWGEIGVAVCVLREGASLAHDDVIDWLRGKLASYKLPKSILIWDDLPKSAYGKISKADVRRML